MTESPKWNFDPAAFLAQRGHRYSSPEDYARAASDNFTNPYLALQEAQKQGFLTAGVQRRFDRLQQTDPETLSPEEAFWVDTIQFGREQLELVGKISPLLAPSDLDQSINGPIPGGAHAQGIGSFGSHGTLDQIAQRKRTEAGLASAELRDKLNHPVRIAPSVRMPGK